MADKGLFSVDDLEKEIIQKVHWYCFICKKYYPNGDYVVENHFKDFHPAIKPTYEDEEDEDFKVNWRLTEHYDMEKAIKLTSQRLKAEVEKAIANRIISIYSDYSYARDITGNWENAEGFRNRLDELLLLYCSLYDVNFVDACKKFGIRYEEMDYEELKKRLFGK